MDQVYRESTKMHGGGHLDHVVGAAAGRIISMHILLQDPAMEP